ncbi:hypothetical protein TNCV_5073911 [Trichonephila clavipes]|nr:hypothetical protein TNCV_5073911 [Trichonephila clavipes]
MPSPVQSNCDAHDTIANGQYGAVWSMGHTQQDDLSSAGVVLLTRPPPCRHSSSFNDFRSRETTLTANRVLAHRFLTTNSRRGARLLARIWTLNFFFETAETTSFLTPTFSFRVHQSGCTISNTGKQR